MVTVAKFQGGGAFNVIPDSVMIEGTFRAFSKVSLIQLKKRIEEVSGQVHILLMKGSTSDVCLSDLVKLTGYQRASCCTKVQCDCRFLQNQEADAPFPSDCK